MAKLHLAHSSWLLLVVDSLVKPRTRASARLAAIPADDGGSLGRLAREACALPAAFARARIARSQVAAVVAETPAVAATLVAALERERNDRAVDLNALCRGLGCCREAYSESASRLSRGQRRQLNDALRTLETEYVRLRDAEQFLYLRRVRQVQTGEVDDDPEFTIVLERVLYAVDKGDDVAASVSQAVQAIAAVLVACIGTEQRSRDG